MNELELKSCPFCASDEVTVGTDDGLKFVRCNGCDAGWALAEDDARDPVSMWNHRASDDGDARAAELKEQLTAIRRVLNAADDDNLALLAETVMVQRRLLAGKLVGSEPFTMPAFESQNGIREYYSAVDLAYYILGGEPEPFASRVELGEDLIHWAANELEFIQPYGTSTWICSYCRAIGDGLGKISHSDCCLYQRARAMTGPQSDT